MTGVENNTIEQHDVAEQSSQQVGSQERIELALQNRLKGRNDEQTLAPKFLNLFQDPKIQASFSTDQLVKYISNMNVDRILQEISFDDKEADVDSLLGYIDFAANEPVTDTYIIQSDENTTKDALNSNIEGQENQKEKILTKSEIIQQKRQETQKAYNALDPNLRTTAKTIKPANILAPSILARIQEQIKGTGIDIEEYAQFAYAEQEINSGRAADNEEFLEKFQDLKKSLGIVETLSDLSAKNINNTANTLLTQNTSVRDFVNNDQAWDKRISKPAYFQESKNEQESDLLIQKFSDKDTQQQLQALKSKFLGNAVDLNENPDYQAYLTLRDATVHQIQEQLGTTTHSLMKENITVSQICGMAKYFDTSTAQDKNFAENFQLNVQDDIHLDTEHGIVHIGGYMNTSNGPKYIGFSQDMYKKDPLHGNLRADDYLSHDKSGSTFTYRGQGGTEQSDLHLNLPTTDQLSLLAQDFSDNAKMESLIKSSTSLEDFQRMFGEQLREKLVNAYGDKELYQNRIKRQVEKNIAAQELQASRFPGAENKTISQSINKNAWNLSKKFDDFLENHTPQEVMRLKTANKKLDDIIKKGPDAKAPLEPKRKNLVTQLQTERDAQDIDDEGLSATMKLFHYVSDSQDKFYLNDFEKLVTLLGSPTETIDKHMNVFSSTFKSHLQEEKDVADVENLEQQLENFA